MQICFSLPHVFVPGSSQTESSTALRILLNTLISLNQAYLEKHATLPLYQSGVRYGRTQVWECIPALYARGYGDCKSLSAALIAEYRRQGKLCEPVFRWQKSRDPLRPNDIDYHILVLLGDGTFEDPSKRLGMGHNENARY